MDISDSFTIVSSIDDLTHRNDDDDETYSAEQLQQLGASDSEPVRDSVTDDDSQGNVQ